MLDKVFEHHDGLVRSKLPQGMNCDTRIKIKQRHAECAWEVQDHVVRVERLVEALDELCDKYDSPETRRIWQLVKELQNDQ